MNRTWIAVSATLTGCFAAGMPRSIAADAWGGSLALTSNYLVRGITRSADGAALQGDLHIANRSGLIAGLFASSAQIDPRAQTDVELEAFVGLARDIGDSWRGKALVSHYSYPWNAHPSHYEYDELDLDAAYRDWLDFNVAYSPNSPRFVATRGFASVTSKAVELNLRLPTHNKISASAGLGHVWLDGPDAARYAYWSVAAGYDLAAVTLAVSYVRTVSGAQYLYYDIPTGGRWTGTVLWRF